MKETKPSWEEAFIKEFGNLYIERYDQTLDETRFLEDMLRFIRVVEKAERERCIAIVHKLRYQWQVIDIGGKRHIDPSQVDAHVDKILAEIKEGR